MMEKQNEPCVICEAYIVGIECENECCPVFKMKAENSVLKNTISRLKSEVSKLKSDASWDEDIRRGQVQGMW